jgi:hypothetical protein
VIPAAHPLKVICGRGRLMVEPREAGYPSTVQQDHEASIAEIDAGTRLLASESPRLRQAVLARPTVRLSAALRRRGLHRVLVVEDAA